MSIFDQIPDDALAPSETALFGELLSDLSKGLLLYHEKAASILKDSGIRLMDPGPDFAAVEKNFFSFLFLYALHRCGLKGSRKVFYVAVNQCLRGMVTGCDNILDNEYKKTLDTDLPPTGTKFRSIVDIMASDRILFDLLLDRCQREELTLSQVSRAHAASLSALSPSGVSESGEEAGIEIVLPPKTILEKVHHYKTGVLFLCPLALPCLLEKPDPAAVENVESALYMIGMGCQVMDDIVDFSMDLSMKRHNHMVSLVHHGDSRNELLRLEEIRGGQLSGGARPPRAGSFPKALASAVKTADEYLNRGMAALLAPEHRALLTPAVTFLEKRIGAFAYMSEFRE